MKFNLEIFTEFLKNVDLSKYKELYSKIKIVEMDLPKNIQALDTIYSTYWERTGNENSKGKPLDFEEFYEKYYQNCKNNIENFWDKTGFDKNCNCFLKGLKARIYRTWASLITQIHAGYVAETVFGKDSVIMNTELDHKGVDMLIKYRNNDIKIQIKKDSKRPEISRMYNSLSDVDDINKIWYIVPSPDDYCNPYYKILAKQGQLRDCVKQFKKYNPNGTLDRLDNGFVIFTTKEFEEIKKNIDNLLDKN